MSISTIFPRQIVKPMTDIAHSEATQRFQWQSCGRNCGGTGPRLEVNVQRLLTTLARSTKEREVKIRVKADPKLNQLVRSNSVEWHPLAEPDVPGVYVKVLRFDPATNRAPTILLKFDPGATYPGHVHPGGEEIFVIAGDIRLGKDQLYAGDYLYTAPHNIHAVQSKGGCVVLLIVPQEVEKLQRKSARAGETSSGA